MPGRRRALTFLIIAPLFGANGSLLPTDVGQWNSRYLKNPGNERMWDRGVSQWAITCVHAWARAIFPRQTLRRAYELRGSVAHGKHLFDKLNRGERVVVAAIGSSVVAFNGGCWQASANELFALGVELNPTMYPRGRWDSEKIYSIDNNHQCECCNRGYMLGFMDMINSTWPHANHTFLNLGWSVFHP